MKFLADQDVYQLTVEFLRSLGHDVQTAREAKMSRASDEKLLEHARKSQRIMITRDKGFGALVFLEEKNHSGVFLLRIDPASINAVHEELKKVLEIHSAMDMTKFFIVIQEGQHRIRSIS